jgi:large subunit ribosomal protein L30e
MGKKTKKSAESMNSRLALVMKSGKAFLGFKLTLKALRQSRTKLIFIASNCPPLRKSMAEYYAFLAGANVQHFAGNNNELGKACGKIYGVSVLSIIDAGDSDILSVAAN